MAESIHIVADGCDFSEFLMKKALRKECLAKNGFAGGKVHIGLNPHAAYDTPTAFCHTLANLFKHEGIVFFHPFIITGACACENKIGRFVQPIQSRTESSQHFMIPFPPQP